MKAAEAKLKIQEILDIPIERRFPSVGPLTRAALDKLAATPNDSEWPPAVSSTRQLNQDSIDLIKHFESLFLKAYPDPVGVWTIGWGHTGLTHNDGTVYPGRTITATEAESLLRHDLNAFSKRVIDNVTVPLNDNQFGALVSFDFNTGGLLVSTLLKKLNAGDYKGASEELPRWVRAGGRVLRGLVRRRASEKNLFLSKQPYIVT